ncbi:MAG: glutathione S-transferase N-terminal domain-containing protein [Raoultibacter sp.]
MTLLDVTQDLDAKAALVRAGGTGQVPCLLIDGKLLYESDDIIAYFEKIA